LAACNSFEGKLGLRDPGVTGYVAHLVCEFSEADKLYNVRDGSGHRIKELYELMLAADPGRDGDGLRGREREPTGTCGRIEERFLRRKVRGLARAAGSPLRDGILYNYPHNVRRTPYRS